jgi:hypothetical protein
MPGLVVVRPRSGLRPIIEDLLLIAEATTPEEWEGSIQYLPL